MKKIVTLLALVLMLSLVACNNSKDSTSANATAEKSSGSTESTSTNDDSNAPTESVASTEGTGEEAQDTAADEDADQTDEKATDGTKKPVEYLQVDLENGVLIDQDNVKITTHGLSQTDNGPALDLTIENNRDADIKVFVSFLSVNDHVVDSQKTDSWYCNILDVENNNMEMHLFVNKNSSKQAKLVFQQDMLDLSQIKEIGKIEFQLSIDTESFTAIYVEKPIQILVNKNVHQPAIEHKGETIIDMEGVKVSYEIVDVETSIGKNIVFYMTNESERDAQVQLRNFSIDDTILYPPFHVFIARNKQAIVPLYGLQHLIDDGQVKEVNKFSFRMVVLPDTDSLPFAYSDKGIEVDITK